MSDISSTLKEADIYAIAYVLALANGHNDPVAYAVKVLDAYKAHEPKGEG
jgi:hypothetical protein